MAKVQRVADRRGPIFRRLARAVLILLGVTLTSCGASDDENSSLIELSTRDLHLDAVFGGSATYAQLRVTHNGLGVELLGLEQAPWLGYDLKPDQFDFTTYEFWPTDTTLPGAHHALDLRLDIYREVAFKWKVGSSRLAADGQHPGYAPRRQYVSPAEV